MSGRNLPRPAKSCAPQNAREAYCAESWLPLVEQLQTESIALCKVQNSRVMKQNVWKKPAKTCQKLCAAKRA